jgi:hypothetical protein
MMPVAVLLLWLAARHIGTAEEGRAASARAAGEKLEALGNASA